jgi:hypothetical protein
MNTIQRILANSEVEMGKKITIPERERLLIRVSSFLMRPVGNWTRRGPQYPMLIRKKSYSF